MKRLPDWPERLSAYVEACRAMPFVWGEHDCVLFAAGAVEAVTGVRPALPVWRSQEEARVMLRAERGLRRALDRRMPQIETAQAGRGDLLLVQQPNDGGSLLTVCVGDRWCAPGAAGRVVGPALSARYAWGVGACHKQ